MILSGYKLSLDFSDYILATFPCRRVFVGLNSKLLDMHNQFLKNWIKLPKLWRTSPNNVNLS